MCAIDLERGAGGGVEADIITWSSIRDAALGIIVDCVMNSRGSSRQFSGLGGTIRGLGMLRVYLPAVAKRPILFHSRLTAAADALSRPESPDQCCLEILRAESSLLRQRIPGSCATMSKNFVCDAHTPKLDDLAT